MTIRTRFAPSPTGFLHIGGARTALFAWLYARHHQGQFILRIEDTDRERSTEASIRAILDGMAWLNLDYDEGPFYQTQRMDRYREVIQQLITENKAYYCTCSKERLEQLRTDQMSRKEKPRYDGCCRDKNIKAQSDCVVRFKNPLTGKVAFDDLIRGKISFNNAELDDFVILRSDQTPTYNFCVVVDDLDMKITDVIRGDDHINNTPRQINLFAAFNATTPRFAHVPMILGSDGKRLSKRHGAVSVLQFKEEGYLPQALTNYLARLGWSHGDQEIFSTEELINLFSLKQVNNSPAAFNMEKLIWLNQHYLKTLDPAHIAPLLAEQFKSLGVDIAQGPALADVVKIQAEKVKTLREMAEHSCYFYEDDFEYDMTSVNKFLLNDGLDVLKSFKSYLQDIKQWSKETIHEAIASFTQTKQLNMGKVAQPLRIAVTGSTVSPSIDVTLFLVGKEKTLSRIEKAINRFS